ncbi:MAG: hypothetical protein IKZ38_02715 [Clostridia bacterium]|nr:hypothetical protein [Clostridia bacterium]
MKKFFVTILSAVCLLSFATFGVACGGGENPGGTNAAEYVENKALIVQNYNDKLESLKTLTLFKGSDLNFSEEIASIFNQITSIDKKFDASLSVGSFDSAIPENPTLSKLGSVSAVFKDGELDLIKTTQGQGGMQEISMSVFIDGDNLYVAQVEKTGAVEMIATLPLNYINQMLEEKAGIGPDTIVDVPFISKALLGDETAIATYIDMIPRLDVEDIEYDSTTKEHKIKSTYYKEILYAVIDVLPEDLIEGVSPATLKTAAGGILDNLGLTTSIKVTSDDKVETTFSIKPNETFFDMIYENAYANSDPAQRPINEVALELFVSEAKTSINLDVKGAMIEKAKLYAEVAGSENSISTKTDIDVKILLDEETISGNLESAYSVDEDFNVNGSLAVKVNAGGVKADVDASLVASPTAINCDFNVNELVIDESSNEWYEELEGNVRPLNATCNMEFGANFITGAFEGVIDVDVNDNLERIDGSEKEYRSENIDITLKGNMLDFLGKAEKVPMEIDVKLISTLTRYNQNGELVETKAGGRIDGYAKATNVEDGKTVIDGAIEMISQGKQEIDEAYAAKLVLELTELGDEYQFAVSNEIKSIAKNNLDYARVLGENKPLPQAVYTATYNALEDFMSRPQTVTSGNVSYAVEINKGVFAVIEYYYDIDSGFTYMKDERVYFASNPIQIATIGYGINIID